MLINSKYIIDVNFDFTKDTPHFWDKYWDSDKVLGHFNNDPDIASPTLQTYHKILWSKPLPNGDILDLKVGYGSNYLTWKNFRFGSDSITASFRYIRYRYMIEQVAQVVPNYINFMEDYIRKSYTIGGAIIFPKWHGGINQSRGCNSLIKDRWDLTLECIRKFYLDEPSPLYNTLVKDKRFFELFKDFKGYVDFFYLQDCVSTDYNAVKIWLGDGKFKSSPLPQSVEEYLHWIECQLEFVKKRNERIKKATLSV